MAQVNVINVICQDAKAPFTSSINFEIFFEALQPLTKSRSLLSIICIVSGRNLIKI
jgi:hypothetical protein